MAPSNATLPAGVNEVEFNLTGTDSSIFAAPLVSKSGNVWFQGQASDEQGLRALLVIDGDPEEVLANLGPWDVRSADGSLVTLDNNNGVHRSEPRKYAATINKGPNKGAAHPKAGQVIPNTGGNLTITWSGSVPLVGGDASEKVGEVKNYTTMVTVTQIRASDRDVKKGHAEAIGDHLGYSVSVKAMGQPQAKPKEATGRSVGFATISL